MYSTFLVFLIFYMIASCQAQIPSASPCMEMERTPNYDPAKIVGRWYRYAAYPSASPHGRCRQTIFDSTNNGSTLTIFEKQLSLSPGDTPVWYQVYIINYIGDSSYFVTYPTDISYSNQTVTFWNTDYTSYAIKGICVNSNNASMYYVWILTRSPHPSPSVIAKINEAVKMDEFPVQYFQKEDQMNCPSDF